MRDARVVYLETSNFQGISIGAIHWYGKLIGYNPYKEVELVHELTQDEADKLNDHYWSLYPGDKDFYRFRAGRESKQFFTEDQVIKFAVRVHRIHFPDARILLLGNPIYSEPKKVLYGDKEFRFYSNKVYRYCDKLGWFDRGNGDEVSRINKEWESKLMGVLNQ